MTNATTGPFASFYEFYQTYFSNSIAPGVPRIELASRFLPRSLAVTDPARATKILLSLEGVSINSVAGGAVSRVVPDSTGVNPSWRRAISHITMGVSWDVGSTADYISQQIDQLKQAKPNFFVCGRHRVLVMKSILKNHSSVLITINWHR